MSEFRWRHPRLADLLFAVPNGGARSKVTGAILKAEGVVAGVSDLILMVPNKDYHGLCIEMKTKTGRQSVSQAKWQRKVESEGYKYAVCRSEDEFFQLTEEYLRNNI